jgi:hypothetical protein
MGWIFIKNLSRRAATRARTHGFSKARMQLNARVLSARGELVAHYIDRQCVRDKSF